MGKGAFAFHGSACCLQCVAGCLAAKANCKQIRPLAGPYLWPGSDQYTALLNDQPAGLMTVATIASVSWLATFITSATFSLNT